MATAVSALSGAVRQQAEALERLLWGDPSRVAEGAVGVYLHPVGDPGRLLAMALVQMEEAGRVYLDTLATLPSVQGRGYAGALVRHVQTLASEVWLKVEEGTADTARLLGLYTHLGFERAARPEQYTSYLTDRVVLRWRR